MDCAVASGDTLAHQLYDSVSSLPLTVGPLLIPVARLSENRRYSNVYELLADPFVCDALDLGRMPAPSTINGAASDYERWVALCEAMPRWAGHPLYAAIHGLLAKALDCHCPLNRENAPKIWRACAERLTVEDVGICDVLARMGVKSMYVPVYPREATKGILAQETDTVSLEIHPVLDAGVLTDLEDPAYAEAWSEVPKDLTAYADTLTAAIRRFAEEGYTETRAELPADFRFVRPDPYHAGLGWKKVAEHQALSHEEACLLTAQTLRIWGQACVERGLSLTLCGGDPAQVALLLAYLKGCDGLPTVTYVPTCDGGDVEALPVTYEDLSLGLALDRKDTLDGLRRKLAHYAAHAPIGGLPRPDYPVAHATDVWTLVTARRVLCDLLAEWARNGLAPTALSALEETARRL